MWKQLVDADEAAALAVEGLTMQQTTRRFWILLLLIWSLGPLLWQLYTSFSTDQALVTPFAALEQRWTLDHYQAVLSGNPPFWRYLVNSLFVGACSTALTLVIATPAAYALTRMRHRIGAIGLAEVLTEVDVAAAPPATRIGIPTRTSS